MVTGNSTKKKTTTAARVEPVAAAKAPRTPKGKAKPARKPRTGGDDDEPVRSNPLGLEINADVLCKATKVEGIYDRDPVKFPDAQLIAKMSYDRFLAETPTSA